MLDWIVESPTGFVVMLTVAFLIALGVYVLPALLAWSLGSDYLVAVVALDLFFGWTVIGWIAALVWALQSANGGTFDDEVQERREPFL